MARPLRIALPKEPLRVAMPPVHVAVPALVTLVIVSVLVTGYDGFGHPMGDWQPMPVYISLSILLLALQAFISLNRALGHALYLFLTSLVALIYAANVVFFNGGLGFFHQSAFISS